MAMAAKRKADREETPGAPLSGRLQYEIEPDHTRLGDDYLIALELDATLLRRRGQGPTDGLSSAGC